MDSLVETLTKQIQKRVNTTDECLLNVYLVEKPTGYLFARDHLGTGYFLIMESNGQLGSLTKEIFQKLHKEARRNAIYTPYHIYAQTCAFTSDDIVFHSIKDENAIDESLVEKPVLVESDGEVYEVYRHIRMHGHGYYVQLNGELRCTYNLNEPFHVQQLPKGAKKRTALVS